jgi:hypothetical protein
LGSFTTFLRNKIGYIAFFIVLLYFLFLIRSDLIQNSYLKNERDKMTKNLNAETVKSAYLRSKMSYLMKDSYLDIVARDKLGFIGKNEKAYKVIIKK